MCIVPAGMMSTHTHTHTHTHNIHTIACEVNNLEFCCVAEGKLRGFSSEALSCDDVKSLFAGNGKAWLAFSLARRFHVRMPTSLKNRRPPWNVRRKGTRVDQLHGSHRKKIMATGRTGMFSFLAACSSHKAGGEHSPPRQLKRTFWSFHGHLWLQGAFLAANCQGSDQPWPEGAARWSTSRSSKAQWHSWRLLIPNFVIASGIINLSRHFRTFYKGG
jgi:hypothetical protein